MDGNTGNDHTISISTDHNNFDTDALWHNAQIESPDDPAAANEIFRMADELPLNHPAFRSDPEQFEHFERRDGIIDREWDPYREASHGRLQRDQDMPLDSLVDRHDSVVTTEGQGDKHEATQPEVRLPSQTSPGVQPEDVEEAIYQSTMDHHAVFGRSVDEPDDVDIAEDDWQLFETGVEEMSASRYPRSLTVPTATVETQQTNTSLPNGHVATFTMTNNPAKTEEGGFQYTNNNSDGGYIFQYPNAVQPAGYGRPFQDYNDNYAYTEPPRDDSAGPTPLEQDNSILRISALHPAAPSQQASSTTPDQSQAIAPRRLLSEQEKIHLAHFVNSKQVAYGDQINAMILNHEVDYYPPMPLIPYPKQQGKTSIDHGLPDQYEHFSTEEILAGAVHPDQMFGGLILRLSKTYNNKELGDRIDALLGKKMDRSTYTFRISNAVRAFALKEGITTEQFRARLNQQRPAQASRN